MARNLGLCLCRCAVIAHSGEFLAPNTRQISIKSCPRYDYFLPELPLAASYASR